MEGQWGKFACYSRDYPLADCPWRKAARVPMGQVTLDAAAGGGNALGIVVGGVPVGTAAYEKRSMQLLAAGVESYVQSTMMQLQHRPQHLWRCISTALQHKLDFHLGLVRPSHTLEAATMFDAAILAAANAAAGGIGSTLLNDSLIRRRLAIPARMRGGTLRQRVTRRLITFASTFVETTQRFGDRVLGGQAGLLPLPGLTLPLTRLR